jgi:hypothetical protein
MINFMCEVYFEAERVSDSAEFQASLWDIFGHITAGVELFVTLDADLRKDPGYHYFIFSSVVPFLLVFFSSHFDASKVDPMNLKLVHRLAKSFVSWLDADLLDVVCGKQVCNVVSELLRHLGLNPASVSGAGMSLGGASSAAIRNFSSTPVLPHKQPRGLLRNTSTGVTKPTGSDLDHLARVVEHWRVSHETATSVALSSSSKPDSKDEGIHGEMRKFAKELKLGMDLPSEMQQLAGILRTQMDTEITGVIISILSSKISVSEGQTMVLLGLRGMRLIMESNSFGGADRADLQNRFNELK